MQQNKGRKIIPERTFVVGLCPFHSQYDNIIRMDASTGLLYFSDDVKKCHGCQPRFERGIVVFSSTPQSESQPNFVSMPYDEQGPVDEGFGWPRSNEIPKKTEAPPKFTTAPPNKESSCAPYASSSCSRCEVCCKPAVSLTFGVCEKCQNCEHCGKHTNLGTCKMCRYYESLHQHGTRHRFAKCPFCLTLPIAETAHEIREVRVECETNEVVSVGVVEPPKRSATATTLSDLNPTANAFVPTFVPGEPSRARWFGLL